MKKIALLLKAGWVVSFKKTTKSQTLSKKKRKVLSTSVVCKATKGKTTISSDLVSVKGRSVSKSMVRDAVADLCQKMKKKKLLK